MFYNLIKGGYFASNFRTWIIIFCLKLIQGFVTSCC